MRRASIRNLDGELAYETEPVGPRAFRKNEWRVLAVGSPGSRLASSSSTDTLARFRLGPPGFDRHPPHGRVVRAGDQVVLATTRRGP
ncbi:hypothetical protein [Streptomyces sp. NPDC002133]|uniref:hypothetical protein n=1 Tax=Streptomyces sp. NPDC002133 TaxID=3154409 RepID=UPI0033198E62